MIYQSYHRPHQPMIIKSVSKKNPFLVVSKHLVSNVAIRDVMLLIENFFATRREIAREIHANAVKDCSTEDPGRLTSPSPATSAPTNTNYSFVTPVKLYNQYGNEDPSSLSIEKPKYSKSILSKSMTMNRPFGGLSKAFSLYPARDLSSTFSHFQTNEATTPIPKTGGCVHSTPSKMVLSLRNQCASTQSAHSSESSTPRPWNSIPAGEFCIDEFLKLTKIPRGVAVFDIDDTILYAANKRAITPVVNMIHDLLAQNVEIHLITGRLDDEANVTRNNTILQLSALGLTLGTHYSALILAPHNVRDTMSELSRWKMRQRAVSLALVQRKALTACTYYGIQVEGANPLATSDVLQDRVSTMAMPSSPTSPIAPLPPSTPMNNRDNISPRVRKLHSSTPNSLGAETRGKSDISTPVAATTPTPVASNQFKLVFPAEWILPQLLTSVGDQWGDLLPLNRDSDIQAYNLMMDSQSPRACEVIKDAYEAHINANKDGAEQENKCSLFPLQLRTRKSHFSHISDYKQNYCVVTIANAKNGSRLPLKTLLQSVKLGEPLWGLKLAVAYEAIDL